jgi:hypothetical protein
VARLFRFLFGDALETARMLDGFGFVVAFASQPAEGGEDLTEEMRDPTQGDTGEVTATQSARMGTFHSVHRVEVDHPGRADADPDLE